MIRIFIIGLISLVGFFSQAQGLPPFTLNVTTTPETCFGNGVIDVNVDAVVSGASVNYEIYKLPDLTNPVATGIGQPPPNYPFSFTGLTSGDYKVVATQNSAGQSSQQEKEVTIVDGANAVTPSTTQISHTILCGDDGEITITHTQGSVSTYELLKQDSTGVSQVYPPQSGNTFSGLTPGVYIVSMKDATCGNLVNMTYTIVDFTLGDVEFLGYEAEPNFGSDCSASAVSVKQAIQVPKDAFPITVTFITYPPGGGAPIEQTQTIVFPGGNDPVQVIVGEDIPYFPGTYFFKVKVTNACGVLYLFESAEQPVFFEMEVTAKIAEEICHGIDVSVQNFLGGEYTVVFLEHPPLFVPTVPGDTSPTPHQGPFTDPKVTFGTFNFYQLDSNGDPVLDADGDKIPELTGHYKIKVTDGCGNEVEFEFDISDEIQDPNVFTTPIPSLPNSVPFLDCIDMGTLFVQHEINLEEVYIVGGPADFQTFLTDHVGLPQASLTDPIDISAYIAHPTPNSPYTTLFFDGSKGELSVSGISTPFALVGLGTYQVKIIDVCGNEFIKDVELGPYFGSQAAFTVDLSPGCDNLSGFDITSVLDESFGAITGVIVIDAPADFYTNFGHLENPPGSGVFDALPYKYSVGNVDPDLPPISHIMIGDMPPGHYEFDIRVACVYNTFEFDLPEYLSQTDIDITHNCASFDFQFDHTSNNTQTFKSLETYTLQWFNQSTNVWEDKITSFKPGETVYNVNLQGQFRITKQYATYFYDRLNGDPPGIKLCQEILKEFEVISDPGIKEIHSISCLSGLSEAIVEAIGVQPLSYYIVDDNDDVLIDNGTSNVFVNLVPGTYRFKIEDPCGSTQFGTHQVAEPTAFSVSENNICEGQNGSLSVQCYSIFDYQWYKIESGVETLLSGQTSCELKFQPFDANLDKGVYMVKITFLGDPNSCVNQEISHEINISNPVAGVGQNVTLCHQDQNIDLFTLLNPPYDFGGSWQDVDSTGTLSGSILTTQGLNFGTYNFKYSVDNCFGADDTTVSITLSEVPSIPTIANTPSICEGQDLQLDIDSPTNIYTYTWTAPNGATYTGPSITIYSTTSQDAGQYSVVASLGDCSSDSANVTAEVKLTPDFEIFGDKEICIGTQGDLYIETSSFNINDATYEWTLNGNIIGTGMTLIINDIGNYNVKVTLDQCEFLRSVNVTEKNISDVELRAGCDLQNRFSIEVINSNSFAGANFEWTDPNGSLVGTDVSINITGTSPLGVYKVNIIDAEGCVSTGSFDVTSIDCMIPKGVTPNGDGRNDSFDLSNYNVSKLKIFNRYGREVYQSSNGYTDQWHGQSSSGGSLLPSATYYYIVTFMDGSKRTGWVYLNREE